MRNRIVHVINDAGGGGAEKLLLDCTPMWKQHCEQEIYFLTARGEWLDEFKSTVTTHDLKINKANPASWIRAALALRKAVKNENCIVQAWLYNANVFSSIALFGLKKQSIFWGIHASDFSKNNLGIFSRLSFFLGKSLLNLKLVKPGIIFCSHQSMEFHHKNGFGQNDHSQVIENGIRLTGIPASKPDNRQILRLVTIARYSRQKDIRTLFRGYKLFLDQYPEHDACLYLYGANMDKSNTDLASLIEECELQADKFRLCGFCKNITRIIGSMDLFVLSSRFGEALPISLLESLSLGVPVIASDLDALLNLRSRLNLDPDTMMKFFRTGDAISLAKTIKLAIDHPPDNNTRISIAGRMQTAYSIETCADRYLDAWKRSGG